MSRIYEALRRSGSRLADLGQTGAGRRAVFVVDRAGTVRYRWVGPADDPGVLPDVNEVLKATQAIQ